MPNSGNDPAHCILVVGSVNVDTVVSVERFPSPGETVQARSSETRLGGKGANQAVAAVSGDSEILLFACVGSDRSGLAILKSLENRGLNTETVHRIPDVVTGSALVMIDSTGQNQIICVSGANQALVTRLAELAELVARAEVVVVQAEVPIAVIETTIELAFTLKRPVILNLAPFTDLPPSLLSKVTLLIVNEIEASQLLGIEVPMTVEDAVRSIVPLSGVSTNCIVTLGADGAIYIQDGHQPVHIPAPRPRRVEDTTGAGDHLVGKVAASLARGDSFVEMVRSAVHAASEEVERTKPLLDLASSRTDSIHPGIPEPQTSKRRSSLNVY